MIPSLSLMIGAYICMRMFELIIVKQKFEGSDWLKVPLVLAAIATAAIAIFCVYTILSAGLELPNFG